DFNNDRVSLARLQGNKWQELVGGEHRFRARRRNIRYEEMLQDLIGIASADLFWSTFCVGQPLPEPGQLSQSVQQLLSGSGTYGGEALQKLEHWLGEKTRYTGRLGVSSRDKNKDRELELLQQEKLQLEQAVQTAVASVDAVHVLEEQIASLEQQKREAEKLLAQKEGLHRDWVRWRSLRERYINALQEQRRLYQAQQEAISLQEKLDKLAQEIEQQYPEFLTAPQDLEADLDALVRLEEDLQQQREEIGKLKAAFEKQKQELQQLQEELQGPLAPVVGRPHLAREHRELLQSLRQQQELQNRLASLDSQEEEARAVLTELQAWAGLGEKSLAYYRQAARSALQKYAELQAMLQEQETKQKELASRFGLLQQGSPELLALCRDYHSRKAALEQEYNAVREGHRQASEQLRRYQEEKEDIERQFADLAEIPASAIAMIDSKLDLERKKRALEAEEGTVHTGGRGRACLLVALLALAGAIISLATGQPLVALGLFAATLVAGAYSYVCSRKSKAQTASAELNSVVAELHKLEAQLGRLAQHPLDELAAIHERLKLREQRRQVLSALAGDLPSREQLVRLEEKLSQAGKELTEFKRRLQPVIETLGDPQAAFYEWQSRQEELKRLQERLTLFAREQYGVAPEEVASLNPREAEGWQEVQLLAAIQGEEPETVGEAASWLAALPDTCWADWQEEAERYQEAQAVLHTCTIQRRELEQADEQGRSSLERLAEKIAGLRQKIAPFTETSSGEELEQLLARCSAVEKELEGTRKVLNSLQQNLQEQERKLQEQINYREQLATKLAAILAPAQGQVLQARERWQQWQQMEGERKELSAALAGLFKGWDVKGLEELELKVIDANNTAIQVKNEWQQLVESRPGLPGLEMRDQWEQLEAEYAALEQELRQLQEQIRSLADQILERNKELSVLMSPDVVNIAAARDRIADLELECERLELETAALALAYRELAAVQNLYNTTHRERLAATASQYFSDLTCSPGRQVVLDDNFNIKVAEANGQMVEVTQLSQGAQDQLQVALRLAIADLVAGDYRLPLIFDDPFLNFDNTRLAQLQVSLNNVAARRQILILSHRQEYEKWGLPAQVEVNNN
ncbi:MAG: hypothetical protein GX039_08215, partial [Clostridia bacterium]|nr:hypothetical protein [Clostridia bacterium]